MGRSGQSAWKKKLGLLLEKNAHKACVKYMRRRMNKAEKEGKEFYGEVSVFHLNMIEELQTAFPEAYFLHSVRNGKDVVTSWYYIKRLFVPHIWLGLDKIIKGFNKMDKFEKICWMWRYWNERADELVKDRVRIEDLENFLPIGHPDSPSESFMKHNTPWTKKQKDTFERICGDLHRKYGYNKGYSYGI